MHVVQAGRNRIARTEVISHATAHVYRKREVLSLRVGHPFWALRVNISDTEAHIKVGRHPRTTWDKIASNPHEIGEIAALGPPRNSGNRSGEGEVEVSAQNARAP